MWATDALTPTSVETDTTVFRFWQDSFIHARLISAFAQSHGLGTISDIYASGTPTQVYHYASYVAPAAVSAITGNAAVDIFASFYLPFGILLTGLAAFSLSASIWGKWPGLAASAALILLPDAYQQGFANPYLSYNFMQQVNPGGLYGVACIALAWLFILDGCKTGKYSSVALGYALTIVDLAYKAQIFVANAFLAMIYPCLFFSRMRWHRRLIIGLLFVTVFMFIVAKTQTIAQVPTLRLDGSSAREYLNLLIDQWEPGRLKSFFSRWFWWTDQPLRREVLGVVMILLATFGAWIIACAAVIYTQRRILGPALLLFPVLIIVNYLTMSLGLAMNYNGIGRPEELLNRPLVWAYFAVVVWTVGGAYATVFGDKPPRSVGARICATGALALALAGSSITSTTMSRCSRRPASSHRQPTPPRHGRGINSSRMPRS